MVRGSGRSGLAVMAKYTFKQFQAEYPNDAACLAKLMEINYGGTEITCPGCGVERAKFHPMTKRRAFAYSADTTSIRPQGQSFTSRARTSPSGSSQCTDDQYSPRRCGERNRAPTGCHVQVRLAHVSRVAKAHGGSRWSRRQAWWPQ